MIDKFKAKDHQIELQLALQALIDALPKCKRRQTSGTECSKVGTHSRLVYDYDPEFLCLGHLKELWGDSQYQAYEEDYRVDYYD